MGTIRSIELTGIKSDACKFISEIPFLMGGLRCYMGIKNNTCNTGGGSYDII